MSALMSSEGEGEFNRPTADCFFQPPCVKPGFAITPVPVNLELRGISENVFKDNF